MDSKVTCFGDRNRTTAGKAQPATEKASFYTGTIQEAIINFETAWNGESDRYSGRATVFSAYSRIG